MLKLSLHIGLPLSMAVALAACGGDGTETKDGTVSGNAPVVEESMPAAAAASALWLGGEKAPLDIQVPHPNGTVLQLTSIQSREAETVVGIRVINGDDREIQLNRFNSNRNGYIVVDSGERIYLSPPPGNRDLAIQPGQTMEGELVFLGRLPQAQSGILILNENNSRENEHTRTPGFRIDLPLSSLVSAPAPAAAQ